MALPVLPSITLGQITPDTGLIKVPPFPLDEDERLALLGVDLNRYEAIEHRETFAPIQAQHYRGMNLPIAKGIATKALGLTPDPLMLTHIVTTRCNYSCGFCSFADTLNAKTNELSLSEIERVYQTIGKSLNVIVYSGGETTLNRNLAEIIEAAYRLTPVQSIYIISNAWKPDVLFEITHRIMQSCPDLHLTWSLSIEGPKPHNNQTRHTRSENWDAWQNTIDTAEGLKRMRKLFGYQQLDVQLCTVCTPDNTHLLDGWYEMVRDLIQPDKWNLNLMRKSVQMSQSSLPDFTERRKAKTLEPFEQRYLEITDRIRQDVLSGKLRFQYHTKDGHDGKMKSAVDLISQDANRRTLLEEPQSFCCRAGAQGAFIGSDGVVGGCEEFALNPLDNKAYGNLRDVDYDFQKLWHSPVAQQHRNMTGKAPECRGCTLESQRNYPSILVSFKTLWEANRLAQHIS